MKSSSKFLIGCFVSLSVCVGALLLIGKEDRTSAEINQPKTTVATKKKQQYKKYELTSINIYSKNITGSYGRVIDTIDCIRYSFIDSKGNIIHKDRDYDGNQKNAYRLHKSKNNKAYIIDKSNYSYASLDFYLTEDMYKNLYK